MNKKEAYELLGEGEINEDDFEKIIEELEAEEWLYLQEMEDRSYEKSR